MFKNAIKFISKFSNANSGATAIQYGLVAAMIGAGLIGATQSVGGELTDNKLHLARTIAHGETDNVLENQGEFVFSDVDPADMVRETIGWAHVTAIGEWTAFKPNGEGDGRVELVKGGYVGGGNFTEGATKTWDDPDTWVHMAASNGAGLEYTTDNLVAGTKYALELKTRRTSNLGSELQIEVGGEVITVKPESREWDSEPLRYEFTAEQLNTIRISEIGAQNTDTPNLGSGIKNVAIVPIG